MNTILLTGMLLFISCGSSSGSGNQDVEVTNSKVISDTSIYTFMELINDHRMSLGLRPLTHDSKIGAIALAHSQNMASGQVPFGHTGFSDRCSSSRVALGGGNWCAENVARGQKTAKEAFISWMNSPGHRINMEQTRATHLGLAFAKNSEGGLYWTQIFIER